MAEDTGSVGDRQFNSGPGQREGEALKQTHIDRMSKS